MLAPFSGDESLRQAMLLANISLFVALLLLLRLLRQPHFRQ
jgi:hypothetical protein